MSKSNLLKKSKPVASKSRQSVKLAGSRQSLLKKAPKLDPVPDPFNGIEYEGNVERDAKKEFTALEVAFKDDAKRERLAWVNAIDSEFWLTLCFRSRAQKEAFLAGLQARLEINFPGDKYCDGEILAAALGIELPTEEPQRQPRGTDPKLAELAM